MKIFKFLRINFMLLVAILTVGITMSFKQVESRKAGTYYYYVSSDMSGGAFGNTTNWSTSNNEIGCISDEPVLPCRVSVPDGQTLNDIVGGKSNTAVLAISEGFKPEP